MHIKTFALNTHDAWHKTYPKLPILTFSPSTALRSSNPIPFSAAFWLPKGLSFVTPRPLTRSSPLFLSYAFSLSMMRHSKAGNPDFTILAALLSRFCLQIFTGDREQTRTGTGGDFLKEELLKRLSHKNIGFLGKPNPLLPHELTSSLCAALSHCPNYKDICPDLPTSPMQLAAALAAHPVPDVYFPKTVHDAEGLQAYPIPDTKGILMHLILPTLLAVPCRRIFYSGS